MRLLIASDIHGDLQAAELLIEVMKEKKCDKILLLGDILYHGPRNNLPEAYNPKGIIELFNRYSEKIMSVRGNCDTEVDQMVLKFPIMAEYAYLAVDGITIFATHGHKYNTETPPPMGEREVLIHGHTHILTVEKFGSDNIYINPGSISLPKGGNPKTYMIYENRRFSIYDVDGNVITSVAR